MQFPIRFLAVLVLLSSCLAAQDDALSRAQKLNRERKHRAAMAILIPMVNSANPSAPAMAEAGRAAMGMRKLAYATDLMLIAHQMDPTNPGYLFDLASGLFNQGRYQESLVHWQVLEGLEIPATSARDRQTWQMRKAAISYSLAETARRLDHTPTAIAAFRRAIDLAPPGSPALSSYREALGGLLLDSGHYDQALQQFDRLIQSHPSNAMHHYHRGVALMELKRDKEAEDSLVNARRLNPKLDQAPMRLGNLFLRRKDYRRADAYFGLCVEINPLSTAGWFGRSRTARLLGMKEDAEKYRKRYEEVKAMAQNIEDELRSLRRRAMKHASDVTSSMRSAEIFLQHRRHEEALEAYNRVLAVDRDNDIATLNVAMILLTLGRRMDAYWELEKILERKPNHPYANLESGRLLLGMGRLPEALKRLHSCENELDAARRASCHEMLVVAYQKLGDQEKVAKHTKLAKSWRATAAGDGG